MPRPALVALVAFLVYIPALFGGYVYDDERFIERNPGVTEGGLSMLPSYFSDSTTHAVVGHDIYRPLRTVEFAIDWKLGFGHAWFFHFHSMLWHVLACVLLYLVLATLLKSPSGALFGALLFALHPVHAESVTWISSRSDVMYSALFLAAILLWLKDKPVLATALFIGSLFSKEAAVMFPAAVFLVDWYRGARKNWLWYGVYGCVSLAYVGIWFSVVEKFGHLDGNLWGGSYPMTLLTMAKGFNHYARVLALPVHFTVDWYLPPSSGLGFAEAKSLLILALLGAAAWLGGRRSRFALAWFFIAILPASNLIVPIGIPTAERFLYLPAMGLALIAGPFFARHPKPAIVVFALLFALTAQRSWTWRSNTALWQAADKVAPVPRGLDYLAGWELATAHELRASLADEPPERHESIRARVREHAETTLRHIDELFRICTEVIQLPISKHFRQNYSRRANALVLLGRPEEALTAAKQAIDEWGEPMAYYNAALASQDLRQWIDAATYLQQAREEGYDKGDLATAIAGMWLRAGLERETAGDKDGALRCFRRSYQAHPTPEARAALQRLG